MCTPELAALPTYDNGSFSLNRRLGSLVGRAVGTTEETRFRLLSSITIYTGTIGRFVGVEEEGEDDGAKLGTDDGLKDTVGSNVGCAVVGEGVGTSDGLGEGRRVGRKVGFLVGRKVGIGVGLKDQKQRGKT